MTPIILGKRPGEPSALRGFFPSAWEEFSELQVRPLHEAVEAAATAAEALPRYEVLDREENPLGGLMLVASEDQHVGLCAVVHWGYVHPEARNTGLYSRLLRAAMQKAREAGLKNFMYTHRVGPGEYLTKYRRIP